LLHSSPFLPFALFKSPADLRAQEGSHLAIGAPKAPVAVFELRPWEAGEGTARPRGGCPRGRIPHGRAVPSHGAVARDAGEVGDGTARPRGMR
jgi:hypothetical protein